MIPSKHFWFYSYLDSKILWILYRAFRGKSNANSRMLTRFLKNGRGVKKPKNSQKYTLCILQYNQHRTTTHKLIQHTIICTLLKIYDDTSLFPANAIPSVSRCWRCFCIVPTHRFIPFLRWMCDVQQRCRPSTQFGCKSHHRFGSIRCSSKGMCRTEEM